MSSSAPTAQKPTQNDPNPSENSDLDALVVAISDATLENNAASPAQLSGSPGKPQGNIDLPRPLRIYTREQLLSLHNSPLVKPPPNMPDLKSWFGRTENEHNLAKKDLDVPASSSTRERRFRRDFDEGEAPSRTSFRSALSQPSQMGNFKHQSLRDRDKDKDGDKERERDTRDKEGHERLRHLSDKYDRDRMGMAAANSRTKDRDASSNLSSGSARNSQTTSATAASRRNEPRESGKRKVVELGDDWRRGGSDLPRSGREERSDTGRKDREERERPRSRQRDRSRSRPEPNRRERASDRDRDEDEDARHWRDDGKRDERIAARRTRDRPLGDHWEPSGDRERRWPANEERDGRTKRTNGRDKRTTHDEPKEKEREKEKEPAWMDTYVPDDTLPSILGGKQGDDGELDGIQAWKKGLKDKEKQEKEKVLASATDTKPGEKGGGGPKTSKNEAPLDEIQLFRLMMQKEKQKRDTEQDSSTANSISDLLASATSVEPVQDGLLNGVKTKDAALEGGLPKQGLIPSLQERKPQDNASGESHFVPPQGSRLLALGRGAVKPPQSSQIPIQAPAPVDANAIQTVGQGQDQPSRSGVGFSPFEEHTLHPQASKTHTPISSMASSDSLQRLQMDRPSLGTQYPGPSENPLAELNSNGHNIAKGSRFAKFFDGKARDLPPSSVKSQSPMGSVSVASPNSLQRPDHGLFSNGIPNNQDERRTVDDLFAMLSNSQSHSSLHNTNLGGGPVLSQQHPNYNGHPNGPIQQQQHHLQHLNPARVESLYDSRLDDRSFVPNDMVPGLRTFPPPRNREIFSETAEGPIHHLQRLARMEPRADPSFSVPVNALYNQQPQHRSLPAQQQYPPNLNPNTAHHLLHNAQRFAPGLANLGNRPPHELSQFTGHPVGAPIPNGLLPQQFNNNNFNNHVQFNNQPQFRGGLPPINLPQHVPLGNVAMPNPHFNGGLGGGHGMGGMANHRVPAGQPRLPPHPQLGLRGQQQPQMHPQMLGQMPPSNGPHTNQPAQDLMALLLGGSHRE